MEAEEAEKRAPSPVYAVPVIETEAHDDIPMVYAVPLETEAQAQAAREENAARKAEDDAARKAEEQFKQMQHQARLGEKARSAVPYIQSIEYYVKHKQMSPDKLRSLLGRQELDTETVCKKLLVLLHPDKFALDNQLQKRANEATKVVMAIRQKARARANAL